MSQALEKLVNWSESHKELPLGTASRALLTRSARLVAAGLAAVVDVASVSKKTPRLQVSAEGAWGDLTKRKFIQRFRLCLVVRSKHRFRVRFMQI